jgi:hypothetical protein
MKLTTDHDEFASLRVTRQLGAASQRRLLLAWRKRRAEGRTTAPLKLRTASMLLKAVVGDDHAA